MAGSVVTVGTFDGVHCGHRAVLQAVREEARRSGLRPLAITFDRHPLEVVAPGRAPRLLMGEEHRDALIREEGVDAERVEFTEDVRHLTAAQWMERLAKEYGVRKLILGYDNTFGSDGRGMTTDDFRRVGERFGVEVERVPEVKGCSSSAIRAAVAAGDMERAAEILGRPYRLEGIVEHGRGFGRRIGVPTANLAISPRLMIPAAGVYAAEAHTPRGSYRAVVNVGNCPTVTDGSQTTVEVHLIDFKGDLYGLEIAVDVKSRLRGEQKFGSVEELTLQIGEDIRRAAKYISKSAN